MRDTVQSKQWYYGVYACDLRLVLYTHPSIFEPSSYSFRLHKYLTSAQWYRFIIRCICIYSIRINRIVFLKCSTIIVTVKSIGFEKLSVPLIINNFNILPPTEITVSLRFSRVKHVYYVAPWRRTVVFIRRDRTHLSYVESFSVWIPFWKFSRHVPWTSLTRYIGSVRRRGMEGDAVGALNAMLAGDKSKIISKFISSVANILPHRIISRERQFVFYLSLCVHTNR